MGKRKANADDQTPSKEKMDIDGEDSGSEDNTDLLNVDFEWFDPQPAVDFHGLKTLLRQLFDVDHQLFDLSELADLILAQPLLGSTVKCDGNESDPFAFLTVLNMYQHRQKNVVQQLVAYLLARTTSSPSRPGGAFAPHAQLAPLLQQQQQQQTSPNATVQVGLVLSERFINMPHQTVPPMYAMLQEEIGWALAEREPYAFSHYLVISKTYREVPSQLETDDAAADAEPTAKKKKKSSPQNATATATASASSSSSGQETFYFHPEDEVLQRYALATAPFDYENQADEGASDAKRTFSDLGVRPQGLMILIEAARFEAAVQAIGQYLGGGE